MIRKSLYNLLLILGLTVLMSTTCKEAHQDDPGNSPCGGYITAKASGSINMDLCCDVFGNYHYMENSSLSFSAGDEEDLFYDIFINLDSNNGPFNGAGTYECGEEKSCSISLYTYDLEGNLIDTYIAVSGTITITKVDQFNFSAEFDVETIDNEPVVKTVNLVGTVVK